MKAGSLFYRLFQAMPTLALELAGILISEQAVYQFCFEEIIWKASALNKSAE